MELFFHNLPSLFPLHFVEMIFITCSTNFFEMAKPYEKQNLYVVLHPASVHSYVSTNLHADKGVASE